MSKNIILCFDGTGNAPEDAMQKTMPWGKVEDDSISNVLKLHLLLGGALDNQSNRFENQISYYYSGVGTYGSWFHKLINQLVAPPNEDVGTIIKRGMKDLYNTFEEGDRLFIFGFSRGAAIARRFASVLNTTFPALGKKPPYIDFIGVFDTVAAIKHPNLVKKELQPASDVVFENRTISPLIKEALHLLSVDDRRIAFFPTLMNKDERVTEIWFAGAHSDIGGGFRYDGLSDLTLQFMLEELKRRNLPLLMLSPCEIDFQALQIEGKELITYDDVILQPNPFGKSHEQEEAGGFKELFLDHRSPRVVLNDIPSVYAPIFHHCVFERINGAIDYDPVPLHSCLNNPYTGSNVPIRVWYSAEKIIEYPNLDEACKANVSTPYALKPGESATFQIQSNLLYSPTNVVLVPSESYFFTVDMNQIWYDANIPATPKGWDRSSVGALTSWLVKWKESDRRLPNAEWFEPVAAIGKSDDHLIRMLNHLGPEKAFKPKAAGELFAFANDMADKYGNNLGSIAVTITRKA